ncbi:MAG TPA: 50S ribosomal protein P1 [archaeon]|nr:50S ribosomal protein P1 [archaeon]
MEYIYAAMLLHSAQKPINEENLTKVVKAAGITVNEAQVKALVAALSEVKIDEALKAVSILPMGQAPQASAPAATAGEEKKKEEKKKVAEEKKEAEAIEGLGALFG